MRYTALEILKLAKVKKPAKQFGAAEVWVAGIEVKEANHVINVQDAKTVEVRVGENTYEAKLDDRTEPSKDVKDVVEAQGRENVKKFEENEKSKGREPKEDT